jgi:hypothetical protein
MIFRGVLERYPGFKVVIGEAGIGWIPYVLNRMDAEREDQFKELDLKMPPSEYWRRRCYATYQTDPVGIKLVEEIGEGNIMRPRTSRTRTASGRIRRDTSSASSAICPLTPGTRSSATTPPSSTDSSTSPWRR